MPDFDTLFSELLPKLHIFKSKNLDDPSKSVNLFAQIANSEFQFIHFIF